MGQVGLYGKLPYSDEFIRRSISHDFLSPWDRWLQQTLAVAKEALGERWRECYMTAPIWRFSLNAGVAGAACQMGVLMPSVDSAGRTFPITFVCAVDCDGLSARSHVSSHAFFEALEEVALSMLDDGQDEAALDAALGAFAQAPTLFPLSSTRSTGEGTFLVVDPTEEAPCVEQYLLRGHAIWSAHLGEGAHVRLTQGLPAANEAAALFDLAETAREEGAS